jgi:hypothetical protein
MIVEGGHDGHGNQDGGQDVEEHQKKKLLTVVGKYVLDAFGNPVYPANRIPDVAQIVYVIPELGQSIDNSLSVLNRDPEISGVEFVPAQGHFRLQIIKNFWRDPESNNIFTKESVGLGIVSARGGFMGFDEANVLEWDYTGDVNLYHVYKKDIRMTRKKNRYKTVLTTDPVELTTDRLRYFANTLDYIFDGNLATLAEGDSLYQVPRSVGISVN